MDFIAFDKIHEDILILIFKYLNSEDIWNTVLALPRLLDVFANSSTILRQFMLSINSLNFKTLNITEKFVDIPFKKFSIIKENSMKLEKITKFVKRYQNSIEKLELQNFRFSNFKEFFDLLSNLNNLKELNLKNCHIEFFKNDFFDSFINLKSLAFDKCNDNIFKVFIKQNKLEKIKVYNNDWTWNGFPHDVFNEICKNSKNMNQIVLYGAGTGSYFDYDEFPFKITKLETSMITFHWYVGIRGARVNFLESQKGSLKELTIHELPYDFDGGRVLKYIIEEMNLESFYYGKIPLILKGQKQEVKEFATSEIQISSAYEMLRQFPSIEKFTLKLSNTDIASDAIERIINPPTDIFNNLKEFEVIDNSSYRGIFGVFLGLYKNLKNIQKLTLRTQDRNINTILECLSVMLNLEQILLTTTAPRAKERYKIIKRIAPNLKKLFIPRQSIDEVLQKFGSTNNQISAIDAIL